MIKIEVFSEESLVKNLKKKNFFKKFVISPRKIPISNENNPPLLLSNNKCIKKLNKILEIKISLQIFFHFL